MQLDWHTCKQVMHLVDAPMLYILQVSSGELLLARDALVQGYASSCNTLVAPFDFEALAGADVEVKESLRELLIGSRLPKSMNVRMCIVGLHPFFHPSTVSAEPPCRRNELSLQFNYSFSR